jgi:hypothetical protein
MLNVNTTLTAAHCGGTIETYGSAPLTITMPSQASVGSRAVIRFVNLGSAPVTLATQAPDVFLANGGATTLTLLVGDTVELHSFNGWVVMGGSLMLKYAGQFGALLAANGWQKLPSGRIEQWGVFTGAAVAGNAVAVTFPMVFPVACRSLVLTPVSSTTATLSAWTDNTPTASGFSGRTNGVTGPIYWQATGY